MIIFNVELVDVYVKCADGSFYRPYLVVGLNNTTKEIIIIKELKFK